MHFTTDTIRNLLAIALSLGTIVYGGYRMFEDFTVLKRDVARIDDTVKEILCILEPNTLECRVKLTGDNL